MFAVLVLPLVIAAAPDDNVDAQKRSPGEEQAPNETEEAPTSIREVVRRERRALESQKAELEQLRIDLKAAEAALDKKIDAMKAIVKKKQDQIDKIKGLREAMLTDKLKRLVKLAEKMPPVEAAAYLSKLDEPTASSILQGMRVRQASKVMAALHPKKAASLSRTYLKNDKPVGRQPGSNKPRP